MESLTDRHPFAVFFVGVAFVVALGCISANLTAQEQYWLQTCALETHGSVEREYAGETIHTDSKGVPYGSSVDWHYYVRTSKGKRIEYKQPYERE
ncbi:MAG: hypothetical protein EKK48_12335 [Candidatus Melainabacteria bacterium]|nr:MAG: hypothetical protein EKK48_12335 [Candidatus Melainabacteria bacterium]